MRGFVQTERNKLLELSRQQDVEIYMLHFLLCRLKKTNKNQLVGEKNTYFIQI